MRVAIVGVGVAGGVLATGLREVPGVEVVAIERVDRNDHANAGNGLNVGPNAIRTLRRALPGMAATLEAAALPWRCWTASTAEGELLYRIPLAEVADCDGIRIRWAELYRVCREGVADAVRFEAECVGVEVAPDGGAVALDLVDAYGRREQMDGLDLVVAADGRYSALRAQLCGTPPVRHLGVANFRCLLGGGDGVGIDDLEQWYNGPNRLLAFRLIDGLVYLSGNFPIEPGGDIPDGARTPEFVRAAYTPSSGRMDPRAAWLLDGACAPDVTLHWSRAQESPTRFHDASGRVLFLGDAAHAMAPTLGQGATSAIEDASLLVMLLRARRGGRPVDVPALLREFAALREARVEFVKRFSWDASDTLRPGIDVVAANRAKNGAKYRDALRRLYTDIPAPGVEAAVTP